MLAHSPITLATTLAGALLLATGAACQADDAPAMAAAARGDTLEAGQIDLGYTLGSPDAPIVVVEFSDFGCPYCARFARTTFPVIQREFIETGLVRWRYVPVTFGFPGGELMGSAAVCAARQGGADAFWRVHDLFYERQVALRGPESRPRLLEWLAELGLDRPRLVECMDDRDTLTLLERHNQASTEWFVRGTPTFVVNGVPMSGALPIDFFRKVFGTVLDPSGM